MADEQEQDDSGRKRAIKVIIGVIILLIIAILVLLWLLTRPQPEVTPPPSEEPPVVAPGTLQPTGGVSAPVSVPVTPQPTPTTPAVPPDGQAALKRLAMAFAERYGSYSNESDFINLLDLKALMSQAMAAKTDSFVADARSRMQSGTAYAGTVSRSLTATVDDFDQAAGKAKITVTAQRREKSGASVDRVYYQDLEIDFIMKGDSWVANSAQWKNEREAPAE